jgi:MOSC domain-containing protein YiiM
MIIQIEHIIISTSHNYVGHHGGPSGNTPPEYKDKVMLIAGKGIAGDRYALREAGHLKQLSFFDMQTIDDLSERYGYAVPPHRVRRNVFVRELDLPSLVGKRFSINNIRLEGIDPCKPCYWMDEAIGPVAEDFLKGRGGLRARILDDGEIEVGEAQFSLIGSFDLKA